MQNCSVCKIDQPLENFYRSKAYRSGRGYRCKACDKAVRAKSRSRSPATLDGYRRRNLAMKYGMQLGDFENLLKAQNNCCAICGPSNPVGEGNTTSRRTFSFAVDHDHTTGKVRGLLCNPCNRGLGFLKDDPSTLFNAFTYLARSCH